MSTLSDYNQFEGYHWETGTVRNYFAYRGFTAPHTQQPYTEALLMGVSGGAVMGYFSFAYEGYDPNVSLLTRNTFSPFNTMLERLGVEQTIIQTSSLDKAVKNLRNVLDDGTPAIAWADMFTLTYNALPYDEGMWAMMPIVVYGYDTEADQVSIADRATVPLTTTIDELASARARVKKDKFRLLTLDMPNPDKLVAAVQKGIWDCIKLYTEQPPKGSKNNFGLAAYKHWVKLLTRPKTRLSWAKEFAPGRNLYAGLTSAHEHLALFGQNGQALDAERSLYADFLEEANVILNNPALVEVATHFRQSSQAWQALGEALLPDDIPLLKETRELRVHKHQLFLSQGNAALPTIYEINTRLDEIRTIVSEDFPMSEAEVVEFRENLSEHVMGIHDIEENAVGLLQAAMG